MNLWRLGTEISNAAAIRELCKTRPLWIHDLIKYFFPTREQLLEVMENHYSLCRFEDPEGFEEMIAGAGKITGLR